MDPAGCWSFIMASGNFWFCLMVERYGVSNNGTKGWVRTCFYQNSHQQLLSYRFTPQVPSLSHDSHWTQSSPFCSSASSSTQQASPYINLSIFEKEKISSVLSWTSNIRLWSGCLNEIFAPHTGLLNNIELFFSRMMLINSCFSLFARLASLSAFSSAYYLWMQALRLIVLPKQLTTKLMIGKQGIMTMSRRVPVYNQAIFCLRIAWLRLILYILTRILVDLGC